MISVKAAGDWKDTETILRKMESHDLYRNLDRYGAMGVSALRDSTPEETGETAHSWDYIITAETGSIRIDWVNYHVNEGVNIAVIIQYGHGTRHGGYVVGRDYINPTMRPIFDKIADDVWKEVIKA